MPHGHHRHGEHHGEHHGQQHAGTSAHGVMTGRIVAPYDVIIGGLAMRWVYPRIAAAVVQDLPTGARVLDVGTGPGRLTLALIRRRPDLQVTGIDPSPDMLARARRRLAGTTVDFVETGAEALPQDSGSVDAVVSSLSSHHWADADAALAEQARVLKPGGQLWIFDLISHLDPALRGVVQRVGLRPDDRDADLGRIATPRFARWHAVKDSRS